MKKLYSICSIFISALFVVSAFIINIPSIKAEGEVPGQVTNLRVTEAYPSAIHFEWDPVDSALYYHIILYDDGVPFDLDYIVTTGCNFWTWECPNSSRMIQVEAVNEYGEGELSESCTGTTLDPPEVLSNITGFEVLSTESGPNEENRSDSITFGYNFPLDTSEFYMECSTNPDMSGSVIIELEPGVGGGSMFSEFNYCEYTLDGFSPETTYYFQAHSRYYLVHADPMYDIFEDIYIETVSNQVSCKTNDPTFAPQTTDENLYWHEINDAGDFYNAGDDFVDVCVATMNWQEFSGIKIYYSTSLDALLDRSCNAVSVPINAWDRLFIHIPGLAPSTTYFMQAVGYNSLGEGKPIEVKEITTKAPEGISTQEGIDVNILDSVTGASLTFESVTSSGLTTVEQLIAPPDDTYFYFEESCGYYNIETTASFDGAVRITLPYDPEQISGLENDLRLYQFKDGEPIDITESVDTENNTISGIVTDHFCTFAIGIPIQYTVTFDSKGGSSVNSINVNHNTTISVPAEPTKTGYNFGGWYVDEECMIAWNFDQDTVTENKILYAKWLYDFSGFFQPVDMNGVLNVAKAGSAIPIKFSLGGDMGLDVFVDGYPKVYNYYEISGQTVDIIETITYSNSGLTYDPVTNQYTYVWKTDKAWAGTCKQLFIKLNDGTVKVIYFKFK
jgi:uncharacterized repeat protein (TIGR02543 family)